MVVFPSNSIGIKSPAVFIHLEVLKKCQTSKSSPAWALPPPPRALVFWNSLGVTLLESLLPDTVLSRHPLFPLKESGWSLGAFFSLPPPAFCFSIIFVADESFARRIDPLPALQRGHGPELPAHPPPYRTFFPPGLASKTEILVRTQAPPAKFAPRCEPFPSFPLPQGSSSL